MSICHGVSRVGVNHHNFFHLGLYENYMYMNVGYQVYLVLVWCDFDVR
jgi:hypothetical protein